MVYEWVWQGMAASLEADRRSGKAAHAHGGTLSVMQGQQANRR